MKKALIGIVLACITLLGATGASASPSQWVKWGKHFDPMFDQMDTTYKQIDTALLSGENARAETLFVRYSVESMALSHDNNSPSATINHDVTTMANLGGVWATEGVWYLTQQYPTTLNTVTIWTNKLIDELNKFTRDITRIE
jgi:hypothetical protein